MAKVRFTKVNLKVNAGQSSLAPPIGPALGQAGLNIQEFCTRFNEASKEKMGQLTPVEITVYKDRSYTFIMKEPPASELLKQVAKIQKGSGKSLTVKAGSITRAQLREAAEKKLPDLNTKDVEKAMKILAGTARQMGLEIK